MLKLQIVFIFPSSLHCMQHSTCASKVSCTMTRNIFVCMFIVKCFYIIAMLFKCNATNSVTKFLATQWPLFIRINHAQEQNITRTLFV